MFELDSLRPRAGSGKKQRARAAAGRRFGWSGERSFAAVIGEAGGLLGEGEQREAGAGGSAGSGAESGENRGSGWEREKTEVRRWDQDEMEIWRWERGKMEVQRWDLGESGESGRAAGQSFGLSGAVLFGTVMGERGFVRWESRERRGLGGRAGSGTESRENGGSALRSGKSRSSALGPRRNGGSALELGSFFPMDGLVLFPPVGA